MRVDELMETGGVTNDLVNVRSMKVDDLDAVVRIDETYSGRRRPVYFEMMIERSLRQGGFQVSLVAEVDRHVVGYVIATLFYGEYGIAEPVASIDAIGVDQSYRRQRIGRALLDQLWSNFAAIGVRSIRTEVEWSDFDLMAFFQSIGFRPSTRLALECPIDPTGAND